jgi:hypothetical protein
MKDRRDAQAAIKSYVCVHGRVKRAVRRNMERFPDDFMFELTKKEFENLRYHFGTSSWGGTRYMPLAFTEEGVATLSGLRMSACVCGKNEEDKF